MAEIESVQIINDWEDNTTEPTPCDEFEVENGTLIYYSGGGQNVTIPVGITWIGDGAFAGCEHLCSVIIPEGVVGIGLYSFKECVNLTSVAMPNSLRRIQNCAFEQCNNLKRINIPEHTQIENSAFAKCDSLADNEGWIIIHDNCFDNVSGASELHVPSNVKIISGGAFSDLKQLKTVIIPENVTEIRCWSFNRCDNLEKVVFLNDTIELDDYVFSGCNLEKLTLYVLPGSSPEQYAINHEMKYSTDFSCLEE